MDNICCNKIYRREIIIQQGIRFIRRKWEDTLFTIKYGLTSSKVAFINEILYFYRQRTGSIMHTMKPTDIALTLEVNDGRMILYKEFEVNLLYIQDISHRMIIGLIRRMDGLTYKGKLEVFKNWKPTNGEFSKQIYPLVESLKESKLSYYTYVAKIWGYKEFLAFKVKVMAKRILR